MLTAGKPKRMAGGNALKQVATADPNLRSGGSNAGGSVFGDDYSNPARRQSNLGGFPIEGRSSSPFRETGMEPLGYGRPPTGGGAGRQSNAQNSQGFGDASSVARMNLNNNRDNSIDNS